MESSITVREALLHAIWKPFITAMTVMPFQSFCKTYRCEPKSRSETAISISPHSSVPDS